MKPGSEFRRVAPEPQVSSSLASGKESCGRRPGARKRKRKREGERIGRPTATTRTTLARLLLKSLLLLAIIKQSCLHKSGQEKFKEKLEFSAAGDIANQHQLKSFGGSKNDFISFVADRQGQQVVASDGSRGAQFRGYREKDELGGGGGGGGDGDGSLEDRRMKMINDASQLEDEMLLRSWNQRPGSSLQFGRVIDIGRFVAEPKTMVNRSSSERNPPTWYPFPDGARTMRAIGVQPRKAALELANFDNNAKSGGPAKVSKPQNEPDSDRLQIKDARARSGTSSETEATISIINNRNRRAAITSETGSTSALANTTSQAELESLRCRVEANLYLDLEEYKQYTCSSCYNLMPKKLFNGKLNYTRRNRKAWLFPELLPEQIIYPNETSLIRPTFNDEQAFIKWRECCSHAIDCCLQNAKYLPRNRTKSTSSSSSSANYELLDDWPRNKCHATWDGLSCWPDTPAGQVATHDCPNHVYFFDFTPACHGSVIKHCFNNGSWYVRSDHEWSDFSNCAILALYATRMVIGSAWHVVSAIVIGPALIVLDRFPNRSGSKRVKILSNLLFWLLVNGLLAATQKIAIIGGVFNKARPEGPPPSGASRLPLVAYNGSNATMQFHHYNQLNKSAADDDYGQWERAMPLMGIPGEQPNVGQSSSPGSSLSSVSNKQQTRRRRHLGPKAEGGFSQPWNDRRRLRHPKHQQQSLLDDHQATTVVGWLKRFHSAERKFKHLNGLFGDYDNYSSNYKSDDVQGSPIASGQLLSFPTTTTINRPDGLDGSNAEVADGNYDGNAPAKAYKYRTISNTGIQVPPPAATMTNAPRRHHRRGRRDNGVTFHTNRLEAAGDNQPQPAPFKPLQSYEPYIEISSALLGQQRSGEAQIGERQTLSEIEAQQLGNVRGGLYPDRCKRSSDNSGAEGAAKQQSAPVVLICWIFSLGIRITRQLGYAWMFTGAVYLCSVLHFAPAEPPALFIKWLMILTNGFPVVIGDNEYVQYLWDTQLDCWLSDTKYAFIEEIADFPNLVLIILNGALFVVTLIIMCRINRPGSTRQEMSLGDYFKAAGTLVVLYGAHYMLIVYRVQVEGCIKDQVIYYSFLFVDGIQGMAVSYVFCYRTPEGKEIISKWWSSKRDSLTTFACCYSNWRREGNRGSRDQGGGLLGKNRRFNQSTKSNNSSNCNGKSEMVTVELLEVKDTPGANKNF